MPSNIIKKCEYQLNDCVFNEFIRIAHANVPLYHGIFQHTCISRISEVGIFFEELWAPIFSDV